MLRLSWLLVLGFLSTATLAAELPPLVHEEIAHLTDHLAKSGCKFNRNGSWYGPVDAVTHLNRKLDYFRDKGTITTAESFIDQAASASSVTGKPYLVQCGQAMPMESATWFRAELARHREERKAAKK